MTRAHRSTRYRGAAAMVVTILGARGIESWTRATALPAEATRRATSYVVPRVSQGPRTLLETAGHAVGGVGHFTTEVARHIETRWRS